MNFNPLYRVTSTRTFPSIDKKVNVLMFHTLLSKWCAKTALLYLTEALNFKMQLSTVLI